MAVFPGLLVEEGRDLLSVQLGDHVPLDLLLAAQLHAHLEMLREDLEAEDAFELPEAPLGIHAGVDLVRNQFQNVRVLQEILFPDRPDFMVPGVRLQGFVVGNDEGRKELLVLAYHHHLVDVLALKNRLLDRNRLYVLPAQEDNGLLGPPDDLELPR